MLTKAQLLKAYNKGSLDEVVKELRRYGYISADKSFDIDEGYHKGAHRVCHIEYKGMEWKFSLHNGEVKSVGYKYA